MIFSRALPSEDQRVTSGRTATARTRDDIAGPSGIDRRLLRLFLLGAANHVQVWRHEGGQAPAEIAVSLVRLLRDPARMHTGAHQ